MREQDRLRLFELHTGDVRLLQENFYEAGRRVANEAGDDSHLWRLGWCCRQPRIKDKRPAFLNDQLLHGRVLRVENNIGLFRQHRRRHKQAKLRALLEPLIAIQHRSLVSGNSIPVHGQTLGPDHTRLVIVPEVIRNFD